MNEKVIEMLKKKVKSALSFIACVSIALGCGMTATAYQNSVKETFQLSYYGTDDIPGKFLIQIEGRPLTRASIQKVEQPASSGLSFEQVISKDTMIDFALPAGGRIEFAQIADSAPDGSFVLYDGGDRLIGYTDKVSVYDSKGRPVEPEITIVNNDLQVTVPEVANKDKDTYTLTFSVYALQSTSARADSFYDYFTSGEWGTIYDADFGRVIDRLSLDLEYAFPLNSIALAAWDTVVNKFGGDAQWKNENGMKDQFMCHNNLASFKRPWNLEPDRPDVGMVDTVIAFCNPKP